MFGGVRAPLTSATSTSLSLTVPPGVSYGPVSVTVDGLTGWSSSFFSSAAQTVGNWDSTAFGPSVEFTVGGEQQNVAAGDLDGDGRVDLVSPNYSGGMVCILPGAGEPGVLNANSFGPRIDLPAWGAPMAIALGDVDGDGKLDIVVANRGGMISVYRNISGADRLNANSFAPRVDFPSSDGELWALALGDLDGDGKLDVVTGSPSSRMMVLRNLGSVGTINFAPAFALPTAGQVVSIALGDLDGDQRLDIIACGFDGYKASIYRNIGVAGALSAASFDNRFDLPLGFYPFGIALADIDGDNRLDLLAINYGGGDLYLYPNIGSPAAPTSGLFGRPVIFPAGSGSFTVAVGDINGDGKLDIAVANNPQNSISVFLNKATEPGITTNTLAPRIDFPAGSGPRAVIFVDMDGDGKLDLVAARLGTANLSVLHNDMQFAPDPPVINQQPLSQTVPAGTAVWLSVTASGAEPLSYQWRMNGTNLPGATSPSLVLQPAQAVQSGVYSVSVSNPSGSTLSTDALLVIDNVPAAGSRSLSVNEDGSVIITLEALDADNDSLTYAVGAPTHGRLTGFPPSLTYFPEPDYNGPDAFTFQVSDGKFLSEIATIAITVVAVNDPPMAFSQAVTVQEGGNVMITLTGSDKDGDALNFVVGQPQHGTVTGVSPNFIYQPQPHYSGPDSFTFVAHDGTISSVSASVDITVVAVNDAPVARFVVGPLYPLPSSPGRLAILAVNNSTATVILDGSSSSDRENDALQYSWAEGSSSSFGTGAQVSRVFGVGFHTVTLTVNDGQVSGFTTVTFEVVAPSAVVNTMRSLVDGANMTRKSSIYENLDAAAASLDKGNMNAALGQLGALQNKLRSQMASSDPKCAAALDNAIQALVNALKRQ
jgi:hypothetical protein